MTEPRFVPAAPGYYVVRWRNIDDAVRTVEDRGSAASEEDLFSMHPVLHWIGVGDVFIPAVLGMNFQTDLNTVVCPNGDVIQDGVLVPLKWNDFREGAMRTLKMRLEGRGEPQEAEPRGWVH